MAHQTGPKYYCPAARRDCTCPPGERCGDRAARGATRRADPLPMPEWPGRLRDALNSR